MTAPGLAEQQRALARALADPSDDTRGLPVSRWAVHQWAHAQLRAVCPVTTGLLDLRGALDAVVDAHLGRGDRPASVHRWGRALLATLAHDEHVERTVSDVALFELSSLAPAAEQPTLPEPWVWRVHPVDVTLAIISGVDPDDLPDEPSPILVHRGPDGRLVADPV